jgi:hypothetical protein
MSQSLPNLPRYIRNTDAFGWQGADGPNGPWRSIAPPQSGTPWQTNTYSHWLPAHRPAPAAGGGGVMSDPTRRQIMQMADEVGITDYAAAARLVRLALAVFRPTPTPVPEEAANPWKDALIDALVCAFLLNEENQSDPRRALHDLISWEVQLARDPLINPPVHPTPVPVIERLPGDQLCWWYEPDEWLQGQGGWTLLRIWGGTGAYTHWLPAHALPLPSGEVE